MQGSQALGLPLSASEAREEFRRVDVDQGGFVEFGEFCAWAASKALVGEAEEQEQADEAEDEGAPSALDVAAPGQPPPGMSKVEALRWTRMQRKTKTKTSQKGELRETSSCTRAEPEEVRPH